MTDESNPEEKPSFFDSADEAKSWPPSEGYEVEESDTPDPVANAPTENISERDALDELLAEESAEETVHPPEVAGTNYMDMLMHDFDAFDGKSAPTQSSEEEFLVPLNKEETKPPKPETHAAAQDTDKVKIIDNEEEDALSDIFTNNNQEKPVAPVTSASNDDDDFDLDKYVQEKTGITPETDNKDTGFVAVPPPVTDSEESTGIVHEEPEEDSKPFRTYSSLDSGEESLPEEGEEETGIFAAANRKILIVGGIVLAVLMYFLFTNVLNRKKEFTGRKRSRRPAKEKRITIEERELVPLWEVSAQKNKSDSADRQLVQTIYRSSGRPNPFAMPASILADLQRSAELELLKKQKPDTYRRLAYRATLVGVLTSNDNTIALVNQQEASFDVLEGTSRKKILELATKSMDKAKKNTQEMVIGSYVGPWVITEIESPESAFSDAKVHIAYQGEKKILNMGKAEELGIFTEEGSIDSLEEPVDLDDFKF